MKVLVLMRHGKSSWKKPVSDEERPLAGRGRRDAPAMGRLLAERIGTPDLILASPATRAAETARLVADACDYPGRVDLRDELYDAQPDDVLDVVRQSQNEAATVMVVGHNPCLDHMWLELSGRSDHLPTAAVAVLRLRVDDWDLAEVPECVEEAEIWIPREVLGGRR